ncbi:MAG: sigma-70 family RNA polymerase sigma factor [Candidatus Pacebacteria bacterium]|nr:sigma-70 family RNA polymerase sigma factor [Candidatus Paceibacterota bacterium]
MIGNKSEKNPKLLMDLAKKGDNNAFAELYDMYFKPVFRYIYLRLKNKRDSEDLAQTVFLKFYKSVSGFREKGKSPLAYFFTIARNSIIDFWRKKKEVRLEDVEEAMEQTPAAEDTQSEVLRDEAAGAINKTLENLSEEQQEVIILKFMNELTNKEIAGLLGKNEEAVRQLQCRALKLLKQHLKK